VDEKTTAHLKHVGCEPATVRSGTGRIRTTELLRASLLETEAGDRLPAKTVLEQLRRCNRVSPPVQLSRISSG